MKKLTTALKMGSMRPKERVLLLVHNDVAKDKTGKEILTAADKHALSEGWKPKDNNEVREYNRYNEGWRTAGFARLDAQTIYLSAEIELLHASRLVDYAVFTDEKKLIERGNKMFGGLDIDSGDALEIILKNSGLEFNYVVYRYAFESLSEELKQDILALDPNAETESQYLDQEEVIAHLFDDKDTLTKEAKERLAEAMVDSPYREYARWWQMTDEVRTWMDDRWIDGFYASLPNVEIAKRWAEYNGVYTKKELNQLEKKDGKEVEAELTEKVKGCARKQNTDIKALLKNTVLQWLDEGLFTDIYTPLCISEGKTTCNDIDTKLPHKEVFRQWLAAKDEAKTMLQKLIDRGELTLKDMSREIFGAKKTLKILTGESLYHLKGDYAFAQDFKKQAEDFLGLGRLIVFLQRHQFLNEYATLLGFVEIFNKLSKVYEIDLTYKVQSWVRRFEDDIKSMNDELRFVAEKMELASYMGNRVVFLKETFTEDMLIDLARIQPGTGETETHYSDEFQKILDGEF